jgi:hypothetical protein
MRALLPLALALALTVAPATAQILGDPEEVDRFGHALASGDFDGDGFHDIAVGVPDEDVAGPNDDAGAVNVLYGRATGLDDLDNQFWHQDSPNVADAAESPDAFGTALAVGDFDGDGYDDLAIGAPNEDVSGVDLAGAVNVLYGSAVGLTAARDQFWHQDSPGITGEPEFYDFFGGALAAGDLDGDGYDDLAVGVQQEDVADVSNAGTVTVLYGAPAGLTAERDQFWSQGSPGVEDNVETNDQFGSELTVGDFDGDGRDDLAIGVPLEGVGAGPDAGAVNVLYGATGGLTADGDQFWSQDSPNVQDAAESEDWFGYALAAGDFDGDGRDDLAIGAPFENIGEGVVNVLYGAPAGLTVRASRHVLQFLYQGHRGLLDMPETRDYYGWSLASGDLDGDGYADLAVGVREEDIPGAEYTGAVSVVYGAAAGLSAPGNQFWTQDSPGILDTAEFGDSFSSSLASGDFDGDGHADLAVGVEHEDVGDVAIAGAVNVLYGTAGGLLATDNQFWHQGATAGLLAGAAASASAVIEQPSAPTLDAPNPNPSGGAVTLAFALPESGPVRLSVYDVLGREVAVLVDGEVGARRHEAVLNGSRLPSGTYVVRLEAGGAVQTQRVTLVR